MRNKFYYILIGILVSFSFINNVFAFEYSVNVLTDTTEVAVGSEVDVDISLKSDATIDACLFNFETSENIEFVKNFDLGGWNVDEGGIGTNGILVKNNSKNADLSSGLNVLRLRYKVNGNGTLKLTTSSYCSDGESDVFTQEKIINFTTKDLSEITTLNNIKINGEQVPNFSPSTYGSYAFVLEKPNFSLEYETTNPDYSDDVVVKMNGEVITNLDNIVWSDPSGQKTADLELIVNDVTTYIIGVRYEGEGLDNTLKSLKIGTQNVQLVEGQTEYKVKVGKDVMVVKVVAELNDSENFKFVGAFENGTSDYNIVGDSGEFAIEIEPVSDQSGGSSITYTIVIEKEGSEESTTPSKPSTSTPSSGDVQENPQTGNMSMFIMILILISSLVGSIFLYQKNLESYK